MIMNRPALVFRVIALIALPVLIITPAYADNHAFAEVHASIYDYPQVQRDNHDAAGYEAASDNANASSPYGAGRAYASTLFDELHLTGGFNGSGVSLHASAAANTSSDSSPEVNPGSASAQAEFSDRLHIPELFRDFPSLSGSYFYFRPEIEGSLSGRGALASASLALGNQTIATDLTGGKQSLSLAVPYADLIVGYVSMDALLFVSAVAPLGSSASANYQDTLNLGIYIGDVNGSPIPGTEGVTLEDADGLVFATAPISVPEPHALAAMSLLLLTLRRPCRN